MALRKNRPARPARRALLALSTAAAGACHTTPNGADIAGGAPIKTPFGSIVAPNITPDQATGIGA